MTVTIQSEQTHALPTYSSADGEIPVRVLVVDDDEEDYLIASELLAEIEGTKFLVEWVRDGDEAVRILTDWGSETLPDICLLDYRLGHFNGLDVLREAIAKGATTPIILLTGQEDSDVDREAVRIGASDYLVKGRINAILVERAIRYARQQKSTLEALREQTDFVSAILDTAGALVVVLDRQGRIVRFNSQCEITTGYTFEEVQGRAFYDFLLAPDEVDSVKEMFGELRFGQGTHNYENDWVTLSGERRRISWSNTTLAGRDGDVGFVVSTGIDVTERRRAQQELALAREREIEVGGSIQRTLLVRKPPMNIPGLAVGAKSLPAQKVGGDYFDFFIFGDLSVDVIVGDVMGKGVPAALMAAAAKSQFQRAVRRLGFTSMPYGRLPEPEEIVAAVHSVLTGDLVRLNSFLTLSYARFDLVKRQMTFVDCGHPGPLHIRAADNSCIRVCGENMPIGMSERERYRQITVPFEPGDVFFFYSDGLTEACDESDELFGDERLMDSVTKLLIKERGIHPQRIVEEMVQSVRDFCEHGNTEISDDLTCVAVRIEDWQVTRRIAYRVWEMRSDPNEMQTARSFIEDFCEEFTFDTIAEGDRFRMVLAVNEAIGNCIEHAYGDDPGGRIQIEAEYFTNQIRFRLYDNGTPFDDRSTVPEPTFDGTRDCGFGLFIMEQCFDAVAHTRDDVGRNCVSLIKELRN